MKRHDIKIPVNGLELDGWLWTPEDSLPTKKLPCIIGLSGFGSLKEQIVPTFLEEWVTKLDIIAIGYDHRCIGTSPGTPRGEIIPALQILDLQDVITWTISQSYVDETKLGVFGPSYGGSLVLATTPIDKRIKAAISMVPMPNGFEVINRLHHPDSIQAFEEMFAQDRKDRAAGKEARMIPTYADSHTEPYQALPCKAGGIALREIYKGKSPQVTLRSVEALRAWYPSAYIDKISPTPFMLVVAENDVLCNTAITFQEYARALEPKSLVVFKGGHSEAYAGKTQQQVLVPMTDFWKRTFFETTVMLT